MSYSNPNVELTYNGNGSDDSFSVNFHYLEGDTTVIQVEQWDYTDPTNPSQSSFVLGVDYTIDESGYPNTVVNTTVPVPVNFKLLIYRSTTPVQTSNFVNGAFPAESVEEAIDKATMVAQEADSTLGRAILNPIHDPTAFQYSDLVTLDATVTDHETRITTNEGDIATNQANISTNQSNISTNTSDIATNTAAIAGNAANIAANTAAIAGIAAPNLVSIVAAATYAASSSDVIIIDTNDTVQVDLPAPTSGNFVRVKVSEKIANKTVVHASGIDGFGTTFTITSEYESISLIADGTKWYII